MQTLILFQILKILIFAWFSHQCLFQDETPNVNVALERKNGFKFGCYSDCYPSKYPSRQQ